MVFHGFAKFIAAGGLPVYLLLALAIFGVAVVAERIKALYFVYPVDADSFYNQIKTFITSDRLEDALAFAAKQGKALLPKLTKSILERADRDDESIKNAHDIASMELIPMITRRLGYLAMIANVATLVGLLGTIHGLIEAFEAVSFADPSQKQTLLAQGISYSMNTTALGLMVAIPIMICFGFLQARQNKVLEDVVGYSAKVVDFLLSRNYQTFNENTAFNGGPLPANSSDHKPAGRKVA